MDKLEKFYTSVIESIGLNNTDGYITHGEDNEHLKLKGASIVMPRDEFQNSLTINGKTDKIIFNPINEDVLSGTDPVLSHMLKIFKINLNLELKSLALGISVMINDKETKSPIVMSSLMTALAEAKGNAKTLIDDKVIEIFSSIATDADLNIITLKIKNGEVINGERSNSVIKVGAPILKALSDEDFTKGYRKKDIRILETVYGWLIEHIAPNGYLSTSHHDACPDFVSFIKGIHNFCSKTKPIEKYIDKSGVYDRLVDCKFDDDDIINVDKLLSPAKLIVSNQHNPNKEEPVVNDVQQQLARELPSVQQDTSLLGQILTHSEPTNNLPMVEYTPPAANMAPAMMHNPTLSNPMHGNPYQPVNSIPTQPYQPVMNQPVMGHPNAGYNPMQANPVQNNSMYGQPYAQPSTNLHSQLFGR